MRGLSYYILLILLKTGVIHLYSVIDIGSNTIRLVVYTLEDGRLRQALSSKSTAGLAGCVEDGALSEEGVEKLVSVLLRFRRVLELLPGCRVFPFATASLRGLSNTPEVLERVRRETGFDIDVITGREEAIFDYRGAVGRMNEQSGVLVDIGGGSTELVFFRSREVISAQSLPIGSLNLFSRFVSGVIPEGKELREMCTEALRLIGPAIPKKGSYVVEPLCGVGGTARAAHALSQAAGGGESYSPSFLRGILSQAESSPRKLMRRILKIAPERVHTLVPGVVILSAVVELCRPETIVTSSYGVREGYLEYQLEKEGILNV